MAKTTGPNTDDLLLALRHPLRRTILRTLIGDKPRSPRELADSLDEPLSNLSYHVRVLLDCGAVKLVRTRQVRGSTQHFYRSTVRVHWARTVLGNPRPSRARRKGKARKTGKKTERGDEIA